MQVLIRNARIVNEGSVFKGCVVLKDQRIARIFRGKNALQEAAGFCETRDMDIDAEGKILIPGIIDDQVHFREPGQPGKGNMSQESRAALLGGVTSVMDMPNNNPAITTVKALEEKYRLGAEKMYVNYAFYMGSTNTNAGEVLHLPPDKGCGLKIFMGSSTGNMLVNDPATLDTFFQQYKGVIATHCEDEAIIKENTQKARSGYGDDIPVILHSKIRSREACIASAQKALDLALRYRSRLHILHVSTKEEVELIRKSRRIHPGITCEASLPHIWFTQADYLRYGMQIKCNPSIKTAEDREAILKAIESRDIQAIGSDHAPHTWEEKQHNYINAPSGIPLIQHSCQMLMECVKHESIGLTSMVDACSHAPARIFGISDRGFIREGYYADLVLIDPEKEYVVTKSQLEYTCRWSPLEGHIFSSSISHVFVNGILAAENGQIIQKPSTLPIL
ncbi:MAG: dihydroorotase [Bacteroidales bacterium]|jgi:dihydroorotase|nr:dihydroorotase [Bacteroidales bacterium]MDD2264659.1 dihydroorotase [Bacteroidales bacterium]MDD2832041.1 dihydroorotase [Bacteroidales bacterium]MDD3209044.1 dihydroorotase [Bacteroidales bacterium]MDD3697878.1 dihydroorotase [Bacteroidales bacterium]